MRLLLALALAPAASAGEFLKLPPDARSAAMGEAGATTGADASVLYYNPAGLSRVRSPSTVVSRAEHVAGMSLNYAAYAHPLGAGALGASLTHFGAGSIARTDASGADAGSFSPYDVAATIGYSRRVTDELSAGAGAKFVQSRILKTARTGAVDLGADYAFSESLRLAASAANLGGRLKFEEEAEPLPSVARAGGSWSAGRFTSALEGVFARGSDAAAALGVEWASGEGEDWSFAARGGFNSRTLASVGGVSGVSMGFGVARRAFRVDYALTPFGGLGIAHRLSLVFGLGGEEPRRRPRRLEADWLR